MVLVPCSDCHRHFRVGAAACPFCGARVASVPTGAPQACATLRVSRGKRAMMCGLVMCGAAWCEACGGGAMNPMYGGPPPPGSPDEIVSFDASLKEDSATLLAEFENGALEHGCTIQQKHDGVVVALCPAGRILVVKEQLKVRVECKGLTEPNCHRLHQQIVGGAAPPDSTPPLESPPK